MAPIAATERRGAPGALTTGVEMLSLLNKLRTPRDERLAMDELRAELREFAYDGLVQLATDLEAGAVLRGTWDGCVLSYRRGHAGSADCDRKGRRGNILTRFWDAERLTPAQVLEAVREEIAARGVQVVHRPVEIDLGPTDREAFVREVRREFCRRGGVL